MTMMRSFEMRGLETLVLFWARPSKILHRVIMLVLVDNAMVQALANATLNTEERDTR